MLNKGVSVALPTHSTCYVEHSDAMQWRAVATFEVAHGLVRVGVLCGRLAGWLWPLDLALTWHFTCAKLLSGTKLPGGVRVAADGCLAGKTT